MKTQKMILLFSKFCLENTLQYRVFYTSKFTCLESKYFFLQVDTKTGESTILINRTNKIWFVNGAFVNAIFAELYLQVITQKV